MAIVLKKKSPMWTSFHALTTLSHAIPCGKSASGLVRVSCVGVMPDLSSQSSGKSPTSTSRISRMTCRTFVVIRMRGRRQSAAERMCRSSASTLLLRRGRLPGTPGSGSGSVTWTSWAGTVVVNCRSIVR